jgi:hypothetical protein
MVIDCHGNFSGINSEKTHFTDSNEFVKWQFWSACTKIVICIARLRNPTLTNREKNCRQGRFAAETRQSRGRQRIS